MMTLLPCSSEDMPGTYSLYPKYHPVYNIPSSYLFTVSVIK